MKRSTKRMAFLDRFYKRFCNHPSSWKKDKRINRKTVRCKLKDDLRAESEDKE